MKRCTAKRGDYPCTLWGGRWCSDCALYKSDVTKPHYKNIEEALKGQRPNDEVVKILSTKFAIVKPALMNGGFGEPFIAGISGGLTVFSFGSLKYIKNTCELKSNLENIRKEVICFDFPENKRYRVYLKKNYDQRKYKQEYRKLSKLI